MDTVVPVISTGLSVTPKSSGEKIMLVIIIEWIQDRHIIRDCTPQNRLIIRQLLV